MLACTHLKSFECCHIHIAQQAQAHFAADDGPTSYAFAKTSSAGCIRQTRVRLICSITIAALLQEVLSSGMAEPRDYSRQLLPVTTAAPPVPLSA